MFSLTKTQNAQAVVNQLLKNLSIYVDPEKIGAELDKHPDYPSLLSISDVLANFNIQNSGFRIEPEKVTAVPCPFLAHTNLNHGDFLVVHQINAQNVIVSSDKWNWHQLSPEEFKKIFTGVVLTAERAEGASPVKSAGITLAGIKKPAIAIGMVLVFLAALIFRSNYFTVLSWQSLLLTLFKSAGLVTSVLLLIQSIDSNNPLVQVLCQSGGKTDCNAILSSKAAKVFEGLTWSEVGFFYFAGTWLLLLFGGGSAITWQVLALLNFVSLPYTVYSIYFQARVAKQWCVLCCTVQALLWLEFVVLITTVSKPALPGRVWEGLYFVYLFIISTITLFFCNWGK